ncbi:TfoX/Sxy family protein [Methyloradius palustris]|uniref:Competence protein TfoX n=1 Tax=Methyloradius palustris TaxID=2778876 RepID=A0A8D5GAJ6_9PROT|nr:TfoX/Sxy family protein [Methyloradius palustris]BCM26046.1 competence protein TfoX [Methyloradius palustris]
MTEFTDFLGEVFKQFGVVNTRRMFGGHGLYHDGVMFGLVIDELLYLKADTSISHYFEARNLGQFEYMRGDRIVKLSYYLAPEEVFDDVDQAAIWARRSFEVAFWSKKAQK